MLLIETKRKNLKDNWSELFTEQLDKVEKKEVSRFKKYLFNQYSEGVNIYLNTSSESGFVALFKLVDLKELYIDLYINAGLHFAKWYSKNSSDLMPKNNGDETTWQREFSRFGELEAAKKVEIVKATAKQELRKNIGRLFRDPDFQQLGAEQQGRILKNRFDKVSAYQAERIVRTEATSAANKGTMKAATDIYGKNSLVKEWISSGDSRTRRFANRDQADHVVMNGVVVDYNDVFMVPTVRGPEKMKHPGDTSLGASASNVINCRCTIAVYPKEDAEVRDDVTLTGITGGVSVSRDL